jgi:hypothetical protein
VLAAEDDENRFPVRPRLSPTLFPVAYPTRRSNLPG